MALGYKTGGRRKGSVNKRTAEVRAKATELGIDPLDVMLMAMREHWKRALAQKNTEKRLYLMKVAHNLATAAAAYVHPKLAATQHSGPDGEPVRFVVIGEEEAASAEEWVRQARAKLGAQE